MDRQRLIKASEGKSEGKGGMNKKEIKEYLVRVKPEDAKIIKGMDVSKLRDLLKSVLNEDQDGDQDYYPPLDEKEGEPPSPPILYELKYSKYIQINKKNIPSLRSVSSEILQNEALDTLEDFDVDEIKDFILDNLYNQDIKNGDVIVLDELKKIYRNCAKCIWYDGKVVHLADEPDEYGLVPYFIKVSPGNFHPRYWINTIDNNMYYWPCDLYRRQCWHNVNFENDVYYTWFFHEGVKEYVVTYEKDLDSFKSKLLDIEVPFTAQNIYAIEIPSEGSMNDSNTSTV
jgi:hypothetical protein